jgi:hypothetical protein
MHIIFLSIGAISPWLASLLFLNVKSRNNGIIILTGGIVVSYIFLNIGINIHWNNLNSMLAADSSINDRMIARACPNSAYFTISQISPPSYPLAR